MIDINLTDLLLTTIINYGAIALGLALALGALGVPIPGTLAVIAVGGFVRQGLIDWPSAAVFGLLGVVLGDSMSYGLGRFAGDRVKSTFRESDAWQRAHTLFNRRGGTAIYLTRWMLTPAAAPINLIAGGSHYPFRRFLGYSISGEAIWIALYGGLGYAFGSQWELVSELSSDFSGLVLGIVIFVGGVYGSVRYRLSQSAPAQEEAAAPPG